MSLLWAQTSFPVCLKARILDNRRRNVGYTCQGMQRERHGQVLSEWCLHHSRWLAHLTLWQPLLTMHVLGHNSVLFLHGRLSHARCEQSHPPRQKRARVAEGGKARNKRYLNVLQVFGYLYQQSAVFLYMDTMPHKPSSDSPRSSQFYRLHQKVSKAYRLPNNIVAKAIVMRQIPPG